MTSISSNSPLASYFAYSAKSPSAAGTANGEKPTPSPAAVKDPLAEIRRFASNLVDSSRGGLLRAMQAQGSAASASIASDRFRAVAEPDVASSKIALPDVAAMDRDDAAKLLAQINKLVEAGLDKSDSFVGYNGDQQTNSLTTYRDWLQAKGGVSVYV